MIKRQNKIELNKFHLPEKLLFSFIIVNFDYIEQETDSKMKLLNDIDEINKIIKINDKNIYKFIYFYRTQILDILYEQEEYLNVNFEVSKNLSSFFYLSLAIKENSAQINFIYPFSFIRQIIKLENNTDNNYGKLMLSKIILELLNNYKETEYFEQEEKEEELEKIENEKKDFIDKNKTILKEIKFDVDLKIDDIYSEIINSLIISKKFDNYDSINNIIQGLDLENIDITKTIFNKLSNCFDQNKEELINDYGINNVKDLLKEKKINFFYFLFYILKSSIYIYNIPFLYIIKKKVLKIVKLENDNLSKIWENKNIEKKKKILNIFLDSEYYFKNYINNSKDNSIISLNNNSISSSKDVSNRKNNSTNNISEISKNSTSTQTQFISNTNEADQNSLNCSINKFSSEIIKDDNSELCNYQIIEFKKKIGQHSKTAEYIIETKKGYLISCGSDNTLYIYNRLYEKKLEIVIPGVSYKIKKSNNQSKEVNEHPGWAFNIYEKENKDNFELFVCTKVGLFTLIISENNGVFSYKKILEKNNDETCFFYFDMGNENYIIGGEKGINLGSPTKKTKIEKQSYRGAIKIDQDLIAFTSNLILSKGEDKLIIYNYKTGGYEKVIKGYSFTISSNSLSLMTFEEKRILLCGCKKYINKNLYDKHYQKNGILLINLNINKEKEPEFYETEDFEVYCFCNIYKEENNNSKKKQFTKTNYFFVGGLEGEKKRGLIRLYKIIKKNDNVDIEYIQDIEFYDKETNNLDSFNGFERNVSCITQSKITGEIYVSCWDGNVFLFSPPNIDFYLKY